MVAGGDLRLLIVAINYSDSIGAKGLRSAACHQLPVSDGLIQTLASGTSTAYLPSSAARHSPAAIGSIISSTRLDLSEVGKLHSNVDCYCTGPACCS